MGKGEIPEKGGGLGSRIMGSLMAYRRENAPKSTA